MSRAPYTNALGLHIPSADADACGYYSPNEPSIPLSPTTVYNLAQQPRLTRQDAIDFMTLAKRRLYDMPIVYKEFVLSMKDWQRRVIERSELIQRIRSLFDGYLDLIQGFRIFVPLIYLDDYDNWHIRRTIPPRD